MSIPSTNIAQQLYDVHTAETMAPKGYPSRPITARVLQPYIALADAFGNSLGKTRSVVVGELLVEAFQDVLRALPREAALKLSAEAEKIILRQLIDEHEVHDHQLAQFFRDQLDDWAIYEGYDPEKDILPVERPHTYFDGIVLENKNPDDNK